MVLLMRETVRNWDKVVSVLPQSTKGRENLTTSVLNISFPFKDLPLAIVKCNKAVDNSQPSNRTSSNKL